MSTLMILRDFIKTIIVVASANIVCVKLFTAVVVPFSNSLLGFGGYDESLDVDQPESGIAVKYFDWIEFSVSHVGTEGQYQSHASSFRHIGNCINDQLSIE